MELQPKNKKSKSCECELRCKAQQCPVRICVSELGFYPSKTWYCKDCANEWKADIACKHCEKHTVHKIVRLLDGTYGFKCKSEIYPFIPPINKWGLIPFEKQATPLSVFCQPSNIPGAKWGLFARVWLPAGTTFLYQGRFVDVNHKGAEYSESELAYMLEWPEYERYGIIGELDKNLMAPRANEPCYSDHIFKTDTYKEKLANGKPNIYQANCVYASNIWGLYLVTCYDISRGTELLVHYGERYQIGRYRRPDDSTKRGGMQQTINVLCLHGCNQTQSMFESIMKNFIRLGEKQYSLKFFFTEGKYDHPIGGKTWYNKPLNVADIGTIEYDRDLVDETLDDIATIVREKNINVLLGFSQGANVVDTFLQHRDCSMIRCAVLFSGYALVDPNRKVIDIPVLTVVSESDEIVPTKWNPVTAYKMTHDKGHKLPTQNSQIRQICNFIKSQKI